MLPGRGACPYLWRPDKGGLSVLMCVGGLDVQVSADLAVPQVDSRVEKGHFFG